MRQDCAIYAVTGNFSPKLGTPTHAPRPHARATRPHQPAARHEPPPSSRQQQVEPGLTKQQDAIAVRRIGAFTAGRCCRGMAHDTGSEAKGWKNPIAKATSMRQASVRQTKLRATTEAQHHEVLRHGVPVWPARTSST